MLCETTSTAERFCVRMHGVKNRRSLLKLVAAILLITIFEYEFHGWLQTIGRGLGSLWALYTVLRAQFSMTELTGDRQYLFLRRKLFSFHRTRRFPRSDVEWVGFEPGNQYDDSALGLMVRTNVMPVRFAHGISASEASDVFTELKTSDCWLAPHIRAVGVALF